VGQGNTESRMDNLMKQPVMIDTDVLIDAGRGVHEATTSLQLLENDACLFVSVITQMELLVGCRNKMESKGGVTCRLLQCPPFWEVKQAF